MQKREKLKLLTFGENADFKQKKGEYDYDYLAVKSARKAA